MAQVVSARFHSSIEANRAIENLLGSRFSADRVKAQHPAAGRVEERTRSAGGNETLRWGAGMGAALCGAFGGFAALISLSLPGGASLGHPFFILMVGAVLGAMCGAVIGGLLGVVLALDRHIEQDQPRDDDIIVATTVLSAPEARRAERALLMDVSSFTRGTLDVNETAEPPPV